MQGGQGERLYTRNGIFKLNSANELVTSTGNRLLGFGIDDQFNLQTTETRPLTIPIGTEAVAKATTEVTMQGNLTSLGDVATTSKIIQSSVLGNNSIPRPPSTVSVQNAVSPLTAGVTVSHTQGGAGNHAEGSVYQYRFVYIDASNRESMPSEPITVTVPLGMLLRIMQLF